MAVIMHKYTHKTSNTEFITLRYHIIDVPEVPQNNVLHACNHSNDLSRLMEQS